MDEAFNDVDYYEIRQEENVEVGQVREAVRGSYAQYPLALYISSHLYRL